MLTVAKIRCFYYIAEIKNLIFVWLCVLCLACYSIQCICNGWFYCIMLVAYTGEHNLGPLKNGINEDAVAPGPEMLEPLLLASNRTKRPDILNHFRSYQGGWDITNKHYWAVSPAICILSCSRDLIGLLKFVIAWALLYLCLLVTVIFLFIWCMIICF